MSNLTSRHLPCAALFHRAAMLLITVLIAPEVARAGAKSCVSGTAPEAAGDLAALASTRGAVDAACECALFDGSSKDRRHGAYVRCAKDAIGAAVDSMQLRRQCKGTLLQAYKHSTCGYATSADPNRDRIVCIEQKIANGKVKCSTKPLGSCVDKPGRKTRNACVDSTTCLDAADDNGNFTFANDPGDDGACAPPAVCGDGVVGAGEACDDGNTTTERPYVYAAPPGSFLPPGDPLEGYMVHWGYDGDGWTYIGFEQTACDSSCQLVDADEGFCGDGIVDAGFETCDDGNNDSGDGCGPYCRHEAEIVVAVDIGIGWSFDAPAFSDLQDALEALYDFELTGLYPPSGDFFEPGGEPNPVLWNGPELDRLALVTYVGEARVDGALASVEGISPASFVDVAPCRVDDITFEDWGYGEKNGAFGNPSAIFPFWWSEAEQAAFGYDESLLLDEALIRYTGRYSLSWASAGQECSNGRDPGQFYGAGGAFDLDYPFAGDIWTDSDVVLIDGTRYVAPGTSEFVLRPVLPYSSETGSNPASALAAAATELLSAPAATSLKAIVLVSDGLPECANVSGADGGECDAWLQDQARSVASSLCDDDVSIFAVSYNSSASAAQSTFLSDMVCGVGRFYETPDAAMLEDIMIEVAHNIPLAVVQ